MGKNAAKKRRSGKPKVTRRAKNTSRYIRPQIKSEVVRKNWDNCLPAKLNMAKMGLKARANGANLTHGAAVAEAAGSENPHADCGDVARLFDVEDTDDLRVIDRNPLRPPLSNDDQRYTAKLMARFGLDHEAMAMDTRVNYNQLTLGKIRRMCNTFLSLRDDQRVVSVPECAAKEAGAAGPETEAGGGEEDVEMGDMGADPATVVTEDATASVAGRKKVKKKAKGSKGKKQQQQH